jgi:hypothetical protein
MRFHGEVKGNRSKASRYGTKKSGLIGHIRGEAIGAHVTCYADDDDRDVVTVSITGDSSNTPRVIFTGVMCPTMSLCDTIFFLLRLGGGMCGDTIITNRDKLKEIIDSTGYK